LLNGQGFHPGLVDAGKLESEVLTMRFDSPAQASDLFSQFLVILFEINGLPLVLVEFLLIIVMGVHVVFELFLDGGNLGMVLYDFLLRIAHHLVLLDLALDDVDALLDGLAVLFEELQAMGDELVLALIQLRDVRLDVSMVEHRVSFVHCSQELKLLTHSQTITTANHQRTPIFDVRGWKIPRSYLSSSLIYRFRLIQLLIVLIWQMDMDMIFLGY
jgi:hypothetical protein